MTPTEPQPNEGEELPPNEPPDEPQDHIDHDDDEVNERLVEPQDKVPDE